ncbi:actin-like protein arp-6 [Magnaporthiopsis poae ATCC 64411]|uniref:Actin-like protein arp-6 n=1 Tax=Magnaporthiopsis poae (strain ATCC 64411 / 73-15) TaxID=644358 RepID=A0A0C4DYN2_MAGP6|nr:actin-like protein arp-6 [Magnaporthiopsis poae ATCC 64411]
MAGGRKSRAAAMSPPRQTLVLDNGAYTLKAGLVARGGDDDNDNNNSPDEAAAKKTVEEQPRVVPNCIARDRHRRTYVGSELSKCRDFGEMAFRRPVERGYIVNWEAQREILGPRAARRARRARSRATLPRRGSCWPSSRGRCRRCRPTATRWCLRSLALRATTGG